MAKAEQAPSQKHALRRLALEVGPLVVFFLANRMEGLFWATGLFMIATVVSLAISYALERRVPLMPLVGGSLILVFGGLTLLLEDELFIKLKPTIVNLLFAAALFAGLALRRNLIKLLFEHAFQLDAVGWRRLTWRWAWFFVVLAALNEIVWRTQSTDVWVDFKVFGIMPLTIVFALFQLPLIQKHQLSDPDAEPDDPASSDDRAPLEKEQRP